MEFREVLKRREIEWPAPYWYVDAGTAAMALCSRRSTRASQPRSGVTDLQALERTLGIPDDIHFVAVATMGYPTAGDAFTEEATSGFKQRRKPREEVVRWERWDGRATRA